MQSIQVKNNQGKYILLILKPEEGDFVKKKIYRKVNSNNERAL